MKDYELRHTVEEPRDYIGGILAQENVALHRIFNTGHSGCFIAQVSDTEGRELVVKIPQNKKSQKEILENIAGFSALSEQGLQQMLPEITQVGSFHNVDYTVTTFLGDDFEHAVRKSRNPEQLYKNSIDRLLPIYKNSLRGNNTDAKDFMDSMKQLLTKNFLEVIIPGGINVSDEIHELLDIDIDALSTMQSCFAVFDFTPDNIYITNEGVKYPDPKSKVRGNPIVDLACFAGVARDAYHLPGSENGYDLLHDFAINDVAQLLGFSSKQAEKIFNLGRAVQYSLSARFRVGKEPIKAQEYTQQALFYLQKIQ